MLTKSVILKEIEKGNIIVDPFQESLVNNQSIDVRLGEFIYIGPEYQLHDLKKYPYETLTNQFILAHTLEFIGTKENSGILPSFKLKSSAGKSAIIHTLAGHGDVGYKNRWAMEFTTAKPIKLKYGMLMGQIYFQRTEELEGDYTSETGNYQHTNDLEQLKREWKPEHILPKELKVVLPPEGWEVGVNNELTTTQRQKLKSIKSPLTTKWNKPR